MPHKLTRWQELEGYAICTVRDADSKSTSLDDAFVLNTARVVYRLHRLAAGPLRGQAKVNRDGNFEGADKSQRGRYLNMVKRAIAQVTNGR